MYMHTITTTAEVEGEYNKKASSGKQQKSTYITKKKTLAQEHKAKNTHIVHHHLHHDHLCVTDRQSKKR